MLRDGPMDGPAFLGYVEQMLAPMLQPRALFARLQFHRDGLLQAQSPVEEGRRSNRRGSATGDRRGPELHLTADERKNTSSLPDASPHDRNLLSSGPYAGLLNPYSTASTKLSFAKYVPAMRLYLFPSEDFPIFAPTATIHVKCVFVERRLVNNCRITDRCLSLVFGTLEGNPRCQFSQRLNDAMHACIAWEKANRSAG